MSRALRGRERRHPPHLSNPIKATTAENHLFMRTQADMAICFLARMVTPGAVTFTQNAAHFAVARSSERKRAPEYKRTSTTRDLV